MNALLIGHQRIIPMNRWKQEIDHLLEGSGIIMNGPNAWDPQVHDERLYQRIVRQGSLGLGEAYMDGWWDSAALDQLFDRVLSAHIHDRLRLSWPVIVGSIAAATRNLQSKSRAFQVGEEHYDLGNDLYEAMLDKRLTYSCGYWKEAATLDEAQEAKLDLVCRKLGLKSGDRVLDIGCGWGSFLGYAAEKYGVSGVGVTVSVEQAKYARERYKNLPIEIRAQDYRELNETFDHIISIGMFEHVGPKNYRTFFSVAKRCLKPDGLFLLHTIGSLKTSPTFDPWIGKYIFPNGKLPSVPQISNAVEGSFVIEDWHNFGSDYDKTLMAWYANVERHWPELSKTYNERFHRMWSYYLLCCAGSFRSRANQLWQVVLSPSGVRGGYESVR